MYTFTHSIFIKRSPQEVFDYIIDLANFSKWQSAAGVDSTEWITDGDPRVGSVYKIVAKFMGGKVESKNEITAWNPPTSYSFKGDAGLLQGEMIREFESQGDGTLFTHTGQIEVRGIFKLVEGWMGRIFEKRLASEFAVLKTVLESNKDRQ